MNLTILRPVVLISTATVVSAQSAGSAHVPSTFPPSNYVKHQETADEAAASSPEVDTGVRSEARDANDVLMFHR